MKKMRVVAAALFLGIAGTVMPLLFRKEVRNYIRIVGWHRPDLWLHGIFYFSHMLQYVKLGRAAMKIADFVPEIMKRKYADSYHGKIVPIDFAAKLVRVEQDIEIKRLDKVIPYGKCMDIIMDHPDSILACKCVCRMSSDQHCTPDEVCLMIGEPVVSLIERQSPRTCRRITQEEAVDILKATDEQGCIHAAFFKDVMGGRFYAICNCCKCCCVALKSHRFAGVPFFGHSGLEPEITEKCDFCGKCAKECPFEAIEFRKKEIPFIDLSICMGCGVCASKCHTDAIKMKRAAGKPEILDISAMI